ncbi:hypothetical protein GCWU000342_00061 [Shuttleworthella satelles DSM 14600]|uniref:Uncharacterized protein n=1 Tax=Shuttleworthella satelles DSM 14600 TaxID=626523 RepID=C4G899_9FIRM|nr:hypothetical protein GCWU000342_00061 [Shuttleworthia satelles DSM 14600]
MSQIPFLEVSQDCANIGRSILQESFLYDSLLKVISCEGLIPGCGFLL